MIENLKKIRQFFKDNRLDFLLINSTDEFLVEYNTLENNSRYKITFFKGSTGDVLISQFGNTLFVDGRYHKQADKEALSEINVEKLPFGKSQYEAIVEMLKKKPNPTLGVFSKKTPYIFYEKLQNDFGNKLSIIEFEEDPLDVEKEIIQELFVVKNEIAGQSAEEKINLVKNYMKEKKLDILPIFKLEEIAYLTNLRSFDLPYSSFFKSKIIFEKEKIFIFIDLKNKKVEEYLSQYFQVTPLKYFQGYLKLIQKTGNPKTIGLDFNNVNLKTYRDLRRTGNNIIELKESFLSDKKAIKNKSELNHLKDCYLKTDIALSRTMMWLKQRIARGVNVSEKILSNKLQEFLKEEGALSLSFEPIVAAAQNSAIVHYSNPSENMLITKNDIVLIDCGAYFEGGYATDITRTFFAGLDNEPTVEQKEIYTTVLKGFLNGLNFKDKFNGFEIDKEVRKIVTFFSKHHLGFNFSHSTGHGVGIGVHESPPYISKIEKAKAPLEKNMVFTIEPGLYNEDKFGVRIENTVYFDGEKINSLSRLKFDDKLINEQMLSSEEIKWLKIYQRRALG